MVAAAVINEPSLTAARASCRVLANNFAYTGKAWLPGGWYAMADWVAPRDGSRRRDAAVWAHQPANHARSGEVLDKYPRLRRACSRA